MVRRLGIGINTVLTGGIKAVAEEAKCCAHNDLVVKKTDQIERGLVSRVSEAYEAAETKTRTNTASQFESRNEKEK